MDDCAIASRGADADGASTNLDPIAVDKSGCRSTDAMQNLDSVC